MDLDELIIENLKLNLLDRAEEVKSIILDNYDELDSFVTDNRSAVDIPKFKNKFKIILDEFEFVRYDEGPVEFVTPVTDSLNFNDLKIAHQILEGVVGIYFEIDGETLKEINTIVTGQRTPIDDTNVYLVSHSKTLEETLINLGKDLIIFPFSGVGPLEDQIFVPAQKYVEENISDWIDQSIQDTKKTMEQGI
jgi:hypothetical protein